ncbi:ABC transporter permease [Streptomyces radicis]|uniref:ABC transporter permease n=1 Tax=Streptomyces radicis TaxID=1750517 RepID=A0A3A9WI62_9ACTN|nr:ABC transporter permease [Streptomyces radicis]RKN12520.1 ABC transporter permease [Streptomyces radicis]RKN27714.1 ABC transporter permease [Streptomyces radicis]
MKSTPIEPRSTAGHEPDAEPNAGAVDTEADTEAERAERQRVADRRSDRRRFLALHGGRLLVGALALLLWQYASGRWVDDFYLSTPTAVAGRLGELISSGELWPHLRMTLLEFGVGLTIGLALGVAIGLGLAFSGIVGQWFYPYVMTLYSLPRVALAPLFIVWFGIGLTSKVVMVVTMVVFVILYNVHEGVRNIDPDLMDMAKSFRASRLATLRWVVFPALTPWLLTALRLAVGLALIGAVIAELVGSSVGLGHYIKLSSNLLDITGVFAGLVVITTVAMIFDHAVGRLGRRLLRYRETHG